MVSEALLWNGLRATSAIENSMWHTMEYHDQSKGWSVVSRRGPYWVLCFFIYINDLCLVCKHTSAILFADDTNLLASGKDLKILESAINSELSNISLWLKVNKLSSNIKKTHYMMFCRRKKLYHNVKLLIVGQAIDEIKP